MHFKNKSGKEKRIRLPIHVYLSYLLVITFIFTGVTFSRYVKSADSSDKARVTKFGTLELFERENRTNGVITPGVNFEKDPVVSFSPDVASEVEVYIFVSVNAPGWTYDKDNEGENEYVICSEDTTLMDWKIYEDWTPVSGIQSETTQVFYQRLHAGESMIEETIILGSGINAWQMRQVDLNTIANGAANITFQAYAVQAYGFDSPEAAWEAVSKK